MKINDSLFIVRRHLRDKKNIVFTLVLIIIFLILFTCSTIIKFSYENKKATINSEMGRTYIIQITDNQIEEVKKIEHIDAVMSNKYLSQQLAYPEELNENGIDGSIQIKPLLKENDNKIIKGRNIQNKNELICSNVFYPHDYDDKIYSKLFLKPNKIINKNVTVTSSNEDNLDEKITFKIVGTYENKYMEQANTCYTDINTYDSIKSNYIGKTVSYDEEGNLVESTLTPYSDIFIRIDNSKNTKQVLNELKERNISYNNYFFLDYTFLNNLYYIPMFIAIITIVISFSILYSYINKKINNNLKNIGTLQAIGYDIKIINNLEVLENTILTILSFIISLIIYMIVLKYLSYNILAEVTYSSYILKYPLILMLLSLIIMILISKIIYNKKINKISQDTIYNIINK